MITAGSYPPFSINFGKDEPGMTLQYRDVKNGQIVWRDYTVDGEVLRSPVDIDELPSGRYRLTATTGKEPPIRSGGRVSGPAVSRTTDQRTTCETRSSLTATVEPIPLVPSVPTTTTVLGAPFPASPGLLTRRCR